MGRTRTLRRAIAREAAKLHGVPHTPHVWKTATAVRIEADTVWALLQGLWRVARTPRLWRAAWRGLPASVQAVEKNHLLVRYRTRTLLRIAQRERG